MVLLVLTYNKREVIANYIADITISTEKNKEQKNKK